MHKYNLSHKINIFGSGSLGHGANAYSHSQRPVPKAFHCSSVVRSWWAIEPCPFERHSIFLYIYVCV